MHPQKIKNCKIAKNAYNVKNIDKIFKLKGVFYNIYTTIRKTNFY